MSHKHTFAASNTWTGRAHVITQQCSEPETADQRAHNIMIKQRVNTLTIHVHMPSSDGSIAHMTLQWATCMHDTFTSHAHATRWRAHMTIQWLCSTGQRLTLNGSTGSHSTATIMINGSTGLQRAYNTHVYISAFNGSTCWHVHVWQCNNHHQPSHRAHIA